MVSKSRKQALVVLGLVLLLIIAIALISAFWPKAEQQFIELGLLGKDGTATEYYSNDNPTITSGTQINWFIYTHNQMSGSQYITVKVKLLNSAMQAPNDNENEPSPYASIDEFPVFLHVNGTQLIPFSWSILDAVSQNDSIVINSLLINGQTVNVNPSVASTSSFCMVFELWVYNQSSQEYSFGWDSGNGIHSASVTMWFNMNLS